MFSVAVCNCPQNTLDPTCLWAVSSRQLDQQQKMPDGHTCWAGNARQRFLLVKCRCWWKTSETGVQWSV